MNIPHFSNNFYNNQCNNVNFKRIVKNEAKDKINNNDKVVTIFSGPSGVGKGTVLGMFKAQHPDFLTDNVSCATRAPRPGEIDGVHYNFLTVDEFKKGINNDEFVEYNEVYPGKFYGTRTADVKRTFDNAKQNVMLEIDVDGAKKAKQELEKAGYPVVSVFIKPDRIERLEEHLIKRGTETPETIKDRVGRAKYEVAQSDKYDVIIENNGNPDENVDDLNKIFNLD